MGIMVIGGCLVLAIWQHYFFTELRSDEPDCPSVDLRRGFALVDRQIKLERPR